MDPILGAAIVAAIQAAASLARSAGMSREEANKYFDDGYVELKENIPAKLPDAV